MKLIIFCLSVTLIFFSTQTKAVDFVESEVTCPETTVVESCARNKIGKDPAFNAVNSRKSSLKCKKFNKVKFRYKSRDKQNLYCHYGMGHKYHYKVRRKIISCKYSTCSKKKAKNRKWVFKIKK